MNNLINTLASAPVNSLAWFISGIAILFYSFTAFKKYLETKQRIPKYFGGASLLAGIGLVIYGGGALFLSDPQVMLQAGIFGFLIVDIGLLINAQVYIQYVVSKRLLRIMLNSALAMLIAVVFVMMLQGGLRIEVQTNLVNFVASQPLSYLRALFLTLTILPVGFLFIQRSRSYREGREKIRSITMGSTYIIVTSIAVANYLLRQNRETVQSAWISLFVVLFFILVIFIFTKSRQEPDSSAASNE